MPHFPPVRVGGGRYRLLRLVRRRGSAVAAGLAVTAAALVAAGPRDAVDADRGGAAGGRPVPAADGARELGRDRTGRGPGGAGTRAGETVTAAVRIADAATVGLLRPGDRVDVIAAEDPAAGGGARVVARGARVVGVPGRAESGAARAGDAGPGALIALSVPRATAVRLAGAGATARLAVTLW
ncbi:RcpC/CpaB family pilus assembly protein [Streptomyces sp. NPDC004065]|uniref:RcpC/CpaB family pilus assembly protein n=1 Tax=Streptomyces sp. NPDC004065 TaxID=3364689 RepID=UPI00384FB53F